MAKNDLDDIEIRTKVKNITSLLEKEIEATKSESAAQIHQDFQNISHYIQRLNGVTQKDKDEMTQALINNFSSYIFPVVDDSNREWHEYYSSLLSKYQTSKSENNLNQQRIDYELNQLISTLQEQKQLLYIELEGKFEDPVKKKFQESEKNKSDLKEWIQHLAAQGMGSQQIGAILFKQTTSKQFNAKQLVSLGDLLGSEYLESAKITPMQNYRDAFFDQIDFSGKDYVSSLRQMLTLFKLPGEAQKIDRFMKAFAERYFAQSEEKIFEDSDTAYILAFSTIMLNTDLHNPQVKNKMTLEQFINNNRGINAGNNLPPEFLTQIYKTIRDDEIKMKPQEEVSTTPEIKSTTGQKIANGLLGAGVGFFAGIGANKFGFGPANLGVKVYGAVAGEDPSPFRRAFGGFAGFLVGTISFSTIILPAVSMLTGLVRGAVDGYELYTKNLKENLSSSLPSDSVSISTSSDKIDSDASNKLTGPTVETTTPSSSVEQKQETQEYQQSMTYMSKKDKETNPSLQEKAQQEKKFPTTPPPEPPNRTPRSDRPS